MNINEKRANLLKNLRKEKKKTQEEMAKDLHYSSKVISSWESGIRFPSDLEDLTKLANYFDISYEELINGERKDKDNISIEEERIKKKYNKIYKKNKKKWIISITILISIIGILLLVYFVFIRNSVNLYSIYYYDNDIEISNNYLLTNKKEDRLIFNKIKSLNNKEINFYEIYTLKNNEKNIIYRNINDNVTAVEQKGYKFYNLIDVVNNDIYMTIYYIDNSTKDVKLNIEKEYSNDKIFYKRVLEVAEKEEEKEELSCNDYFKENYVYNMGTYDKELEYGTVVYFPDNSISLIGNYNSDFSYFSYHFGTEIIGYSIDNVESEYKENGEISLENYSIEKDCLKETCKAKEDWVAYINYLKNKCE